MKNLMMVAFLALALMSYGCAEPQEGKTTPQKHDSQDLVAGVVRTLSKTVVSPGEEFSYTLSIRPGGNITYWLFNDGFPEELEYLSNEGGFFNEDSYEFKEVELKDMSDMEFMVSLKAPQEKGTYTWSGRYFFEGDEDGEPIAGDSQIQVR